MKEEILKELRSILEESVRLYNANSKGLNSTKMY